MQSLPHKKLTPNPSDPKLNLVGRYRRLHFVQINLNSKKIFANEFCINVGIDNMVIYWCFFLIDASAPIELKAL